jgi:hypothetical protein
VVEVSPCLSSLKQRIIGIKSWYFFQLVSQVGIGDLWMLLFLLGSTAAVRGALALFLGLTATTLAGDFRGALLVFLVYRYR